MASKGIQEFVGVLFLSRDYAHKAHLNAKTLAEHKHLQKFYENIVDLTDRFVECWQGRNLKLIGEIPSLPEPTSTSLNVMKRFLEILEQTRDFDPATDTVLNNLIDEIIAEFLRVIYKLNFLK